MRDESFHLCGLSIIASLLFSMHTVGSVVWLQLSRQELDAVVVKEWLGTFYECCC